MGLLPLNGPAGAGRNIGGMKGGRENSTLCNWDYGMEWNGNGRLEKSILAH